MRKQVFGRKLKRDANERRALFKGLMNDLVLKEQIRTTEQKAKAVKGAVEKLITKAKLKGDNAKALLQPYLTSAAIEKVLRDLSVRFVNRSGGYTRIVKLGERFGDSAKMVIIEWVDKTTTTIEKKVENKSKKSVKQVSQNKSTALLKAAKKPVKSAKKETK